MINREVARMKYRIFYKDEDGNTQVYPKEYIHSGTAYSIARKKFGLRFGEDLTMRWVVSKRDPWKKYTTSTKCSICDKTFQALEDSDGCTRTSGVIINNPSYSGNIPENSHNKYYRYTCDNCRHKIMDFINGLKENSNET